MMDVFQKMLSARGLTNKNTIVTYTNQFKKISDLFSSDDEWFNMSEKKILKELEISDFAAVTKYNLLNIAIMLKKYLKQKSDELVAHRTSLHKDVTKKTTENLKTIELQNYEEYFNKFDKNFAETNPAKYIVNKLIQLYGLRNLDLLLTLVKLTGRAKLPNDNVNYLVVRKDRICLEIRDYKTVKANGTKRLSFTKKDEPLLFKAINNYFNSGHRFLLSKRNGEQIAIKSLSKTISGLTDGVKTGQLFKMSVKHFRESGELNKLAEMGASRGTNINTIITNYNANDSS
jgi:hypothetical protein